MTSRIVEDRELEMALDFLRDNAAEIGAAKARVVKAEHMVKHTEALLFLMSEQKTVDAKKAEVRTDQRWLDAADEESEAAGAYEKLRALREAAALKIEAWRSEQATYRAMKV